MASRSGGFGPDRRVTTWQVTKSEGKVGATGPSGELATVIGLVGIAKGMERTDLPE